ncbi:MAG TPA: peroxiredoxin-like family protein [Vicinamibacteria bacterium]
MQLHRERGRIEAAGARLVFVGNGNRHFAAAFRDELRLDEPIYVDTGREAYAALGMKRGVASTLLAPGTWKAGVRAMRGGFRQKRVQGDAWQLGGVLVVRTGGEVAFRHLSASAGDHPPVSDVLAALNA